MARSRRASRCALVGVCCTLVGACTTLSTPPGGGDALLAAFVVLAEEGRPVARAITSGAACPVLVADGSLLPMTTRAPAATLPLRPTRSAPEDSKPSAFPVRVCEATLPTGTIRASVARRPVHPGAAAPRCGAVDRRARRSRILRPRRPGVVAFSRSPPSRAGPRLQ